MSAIELLPCPFCGGEAASVPDPNHSTGWDVGCFSGTCEIEPHVWAVHHTTAIDQWNRRTDLIAASAVEVKPLDLSNMLKHAFIAGRISAGASSSFHGHAWAEYDPTESAAYARILSALHPASPLGAVEMRDKAIELMKPEILKAAGEEYVLEHVMETDWHRQGRHSAVRGMMVRLGLYAELEAAIAAAIRARKGDAL